MISTYTQMNSEIKEALLGGFFVHEGIDTLKYAAKRIEELEKLADYVGFVDDAWYGCPGMRGVPCDAQATGAIIKEQWLDIKCHTCHNVLFKDFKFVRLDLINCKKGKKPNDQ